MDKRENGNSAYVIAPAECSNPSALAANYSALARLTSEISSSPTFDEYCTYNAFKLRWHLMLMMFVIIWGNVKVIRNKQTSRWYR